MGLKSKSDGASPGKIFIGDLPKDTTYATSNKHFGKYGEIIDSMIMKDQLSQATRRFGFITHADSLWVYFQEGIKSRLELSELSQKEMGNQRISRPRKYLVASLP
ncbi:hypothetical protein Ancab_004538 [Ancistrocladus abbreviatus]